jgi:type IV pilus assembly protein PilF
MGNAYYLAGNFDKAIEEQKEAIRLDPRDADAMNTLALAYEQSGCPAEAREQFLAALAVRPSMFEAWGAWGGMEWQQRNCDTAEPVLRIATQIAPYEPATHIYLANVFQALKLREEAIAECEIVIGLDPKNDNVWPLLAGLEISSGRPEEGLRAAEMGLEVRPRDSQLAMMREIALSRMATPADAEEKR